MSERPGCELVTIAAVYSQSELQVLLTLLRTNGIWAHTVGERHAYIEWPIVVALQGVEVRIHVEDLDLARELLSDIERVAFIARIFTPDRALDIVLLLLIFFLFWVPPPARVPACYFLEPRHSLASKA